MGQTKLNILQRVYDSVVRGVLGLPHTKLNRYVEKRKARFNDQALRQKRIQLIAQAFGQSEDIVTQYHDDAEQLQNYDHNIAQVWNSRVRGLMSIRDRTTLYVLLRAYQPQNCIETGTSGGASATVVLDSIAQQGAGKLHSVEIESADQDAYGELIPEHLHAWWQLHLQSDTPILPQVAQSVQKLDFFLHDSDHDRHHMMWEFETVWPHLRGGGVLASHDVLYNTSFEDFQRQHTTEISGGGIIGNFGFWVKK